VSYVNNNPSTSARHLNSGIVQLDFKLCIMKSSYILYEIKVPKPPANSSPNSVAMKRYKDSLKSLNTLQLETAIGLMLGDGSLQTQNQGRTYRLKFEWGDIHKDYIDHVVTIFDEWVLSPPHKKERVNHLGNIVITWGAQTLSHEAFKVLADLFHVGTVKGIPANLVQNHLTPRGLAYWFMDDGGKLDYSHNSKGIVFNTQSFTEEEVKSLCEGLKAKFELNCWTKPNKGKTVISISDDSFDKFMNLVNPYIIPSMRYKLPQH
jgi:LAGLIDADG DNA endonuclease family